MLFLLQKENSDDKTLDIEMRIIEEILNHQKYIHSYIFLSINDFKYKKDYPEEYKTAIPIGTIEFVSLWLKIFYNIDNINPIEIPYFLRTEEFLKRDYHIVSADKIPNKGTFFIKDASKLKQFSYSGEMAYFMREDIFGEPKTKFDSSLYLNKDHLYQVSEVVNILSEYRVYIINGKIQAISNYNGNPCVFPDINIIDKANLIYSTKKDYPKSYTMDIMVTNRGTSIIEIHPFLACGLYTTLWGDNLIYAYRDGIDYVVNHNTKPQIS